MVDLARQWIYSDWFYWGLVVIYFITVLSIVGVVLSENRNPLKSLAWVTVLILFPIGGLVLYIFFGRSIKNTRIISRRKKRRLQRNEVVHNSPQATEATVDDRGLGQLGKQLTGAFVYPGNDVGIFSRGADMLESLISDIEGARHYINLQFYIIANDKAGQRLAEVLKQKAAEGVVVRVIYDYIGSMGLGRRYVKELQKAGVQISPFSKVMFPPFGSRINWRNHRKVTVIDGHTGYIGGMNIADRYIDGGDFSSWRDCHLRIQGPSVAALEYSFAVDWHFMGHDLIEEAAGGEPSEEADAIVQMITSGPTSRWSNVAMMMLRAISTARKRIYIQSPYFLPTDSLLRALEAAALSGVDVRVIMPAKSDSRLLTYASRSFVEECLRAGIKIYFYEKGMLHSKMMIIDDEISTVGSTNFDFRSFEHNFESNVFVYSKDINARLSMVFTDDLAASRRIRPSQWRRRHWWHKTRESIIRLLSPVL